MRVSVFTLFPEYFQSALSASLIGRATQSGLLQFDFVNLREFGEGKYKAVDDKPYGGGVGMVMMPTILEAAFAKLLGSAEQVTELEQDVAGFRSSPESKNPKLPLVVFLSPQGQRLTSKWARELAGCEHLVLICGHYEGIDERAVQAFVHQEISIGDYILTGGEPAALVLIDAVARFVPGVVGDQASVENDTFEGAAGLEMVPGGLKYPVFTRPAVWRGHGVPDVLVSGNHGEIAKWRRAQSQERTKERRPDLVAQAPAPRKK